MQTLNKGIISDCYGDRYKMLDGNVLRDHNTGTRVIAILNDVWGYLYDKQYF